MKLSGKMTVRFLLYFLTFYGILFVGTTIFTIMAIFKLITGFYYHDIRVLEQSEIERALIQNENDIQISAALYNIAERSGGILQLIDAKGNVLLSSKEGVLREVYDLKQPTVKNSRTWSVAGDKMLLFQEFTASDELLATLQLVNTFPKLSAKDEGLLVERNAIFELFNANGELQFSTSRGSNKKLSPIDLMHTNTAVNEREELLSYSQLENGDIAVVRMPNAHYLALDSMDIMLLKTFAKWFVIYHLLLLFITLGFSLLIGRQYGKPIFYFLKWIEQLSKTDYTRPDNRKLRGRKDNRLKRKYRMYEDVDKSLTRLSVNLQENERKIQQTEKLREDWITGLSHDLKTPLSSIYGYAAFLASDHKWTDEEVKSFATTMMEKSSYMDVLINDLTYTYQLKSDGVVLEKDIINLYDYVDTYINRSAWRELLKIEGEQQVNVLIDSTRFERVLDNVVGNAIKHNPEGTLVHLSLSVEEEFALLEVRDEGEGIPAEVLNNLFNRYYRGTNTTTDGTGTGLGLTIAKQLVEAHGGEVEAVSSSNGTTITIRVPRTDSQTETSSIF